MYVSARLHKNEAKLSGDDPELFDDEHPQGRQILENFLNTSNK